MIFTDMPEFGQGEVAERHSRSEGQQHKRKSHCEDRTGHDSAPLNEACGAYGVTPRGDRCRLFHVHPLLRD
jgi:hypothetical protein